MIDIQTQPRNKIGGLTMSGTTDRPEGQEPQLKINPTIAKLVEIARADEIVALEGFVGPSDPDFVRLYFDLELSGYLEVPKKAIKHAEELDKEKGEKGPVRVYVPASTMVRHVRQTFLPAKDRPERLRLDTGVAIFKKRLECKILMDIACQLQKLAENLERAGYHPNELDELYQARRKIMEKYAALGCGPKDTMIMDCYPGGEEVFV
jgi:hypothetical protein